MATSYKRKTLEQGPIYGPKSKKSKSVSAKKVTTNFSNTELFARSLANPMAQYQARIPDLSTVDTATFSIEQIFDWDPINASGGPNYLAVAMGGSYPIPVIFQTLTKVTNNSNPLPYFVFDNDSTLKYTIDLNAAQKIQEIYTNIRLVSCGIQLEYTGGDNENAGTINTCIISSNDLEWGDRKIEIANSTGAGTGTWNSSLMGAFKQDATALTQDGISNDMILNARDNFSGPGKFGCYYSYRNKQPITQFQAPRVSKTLTSSGATTVTYSPKLFDEWFVANAVVQDTTTVRYRMKLVANFEGMVADNTFPKPSTKPSPMDIYGLQAGVEAGIDTPRLGSLSEGPSYTWKHLEDIGTNKFNQIVALSQGR